MQRYRYTRLRRLARQNSWNDVSDETETKTSEQQPHESNSDKPADTNKDSNSVNKSSFRVEIFSVSGVDGKHVQLQETPSCPFEKPSEFIFNPKSIIGERAAVNGLESAAAELLEFVRSIVPPPGEGNPLNLPAIIFLARDLGGTVVKQALLKAFFSSDPLDVFIIKNTTHLLFFGTPHRASEKFSWVLTISNIINYQTGETQGPWSSRVTRQMAESHEATASQFNMLARRCSFKIINYFQVKLDDELYEIIVEKFAATLEFD
ncbi:uncharacterized protein TrAFT101_011790 [Trichoderma asperellum]|uniref:uncharacterized protein n=1 Tax=Trichoderma asperellum TaxID=101201 RepID=UPI003318055D|nr:hypothetical protein TrAFT101_011790 [Trichoderma asperellum]